MTPEQKRAGLITYGALLAACLLALLVGFAVGYLIEVGYL